ncbi:hypothetical protein EB796_023109 [Bugula neritina]|uniref:Uncharacterized protein n=1 Tax=Bugula neritina TaxID=10212 RepID=A0A7J7IXK8_BUGNE|nr:hypothetical protein EB796_023109 [Bugula neritina]
MDAKPPRKADQLLQALSKKYEEKAKDRDARSSGRNTPTRRTPRGSTDRLANSDIADSTDKASSLRSRSARGSPSVRSDLFSSSRRSPSLDGLSTGRRSENRSPAVRASPSLFEKARSPARHVSPVQSPGLLESARMSPSQSPSRRLSPSPSPVSREPQYNPAGDTAQDKSISSRITQRSKLFGRTSTPTKQYSSNINKDTNNYSKSPELQNEREREEINTLNSSLETSTLELANTLPQDSSPDNSIACHETKAESKPTGGDDASPSNYSYKNWTSGAKSDGLSQDNIRDTEHSSTKVLDRSLDGMDDRSESRLSSVSSYSLNHHMAIISPRSTMDASLLSSRSYAVEKEHMDSHMRKLELDNTTLKMENKSLREKYNRAQSQIVHLETKLKTQEGELQKWRSELKKEVSRSKQKNAEVEESLQNSAREEKDEQKRKLELLKLENESLEKELLGVRRMADTAIQSSQIQRIVSGYQVESSSLRDEIKKLKLLLSESESSFENEAESKRRLSEANRKLTNMNNVLKQQLDIDSGGSTVAEKQVKGIETRLKITEDRLFQERADRADKLSEVEDKLLNENAKLQVDVKELTRQLLREREKLKLSEMKLQEMKSNK